MILVNTQNIPGKDYEVISIVKGSTIQAKHIGKDLLSFIKNIFGGELGYYSDMLNEARQKATERMINEAESLNADAVVNIRYTTSMVIQGAAEILVYGTAVKLKG